MAAAVAYWLPWPSVLLSWPMVRREQKTCKRAQRPVTSVLKTLSGAKRKP
jgi:hypothetical protein